MSDALSEAREAQGGLTFDWSKKGWRRPFWLLFFVGASFVFHSFGFYFFRVVYPPQKRELLSAYSVTVLDPAQPLTRDVLSRIDDRVVAFDARGALDLPGTDHEESSVHFRPLFRDYEPALRELPPPGGAGEASLFPKGRLFMPPSNPGRAEVAAADPESDFFQPIASIRWEGGEREVLRGFEWVPQEGVVRPPHIDRSVVYIGVDRSGHVTHALTEQGAGPEIDMAIYRAVRGMRFSKSAMSGMDWAWITVRW